MDEPRIAAPVEAGTIALVLAAFLSLGGVIGTLTAFTATGVVASLLPLFFAFAGGSAIAFSGQADRRAAVAASVAIIGMSLGCLLGVYTGIYVAQHKLLTPPESRASPASGSYLREFSVDQAEMIEQLRQAGTLSTEDAYKQLLEVSRKRSSAARP